MSPRAAEEPIPELSNAEREKLAPVYAERLVEAYGDPHAALHFDNAYQLLIAVILSAQTTDVGVNKATPALFERYPTPEDLAGADQEEVEAYVKTLGFFHQKARNIIATACWARRSARLRVSRWTRMSSVSRTASGCRPSAIPTRWSAT